MKFFIIGLAMAAALSVTSVAAKAVERAESTSKVEVAPVGETIAPVATFTLAPDSLVGKFAYIITAATFALGVVATGGTRTLSQAQLTVTKALPSANANTASDAIDTNTVTPGRIPHIELGVTIPALPNLVDAKTATFKVQDSADGTNFADVADLPAIALVGAGGVGNAGTDRRFKVPITMRQYVRLYQAIENAGGDSTAVSSSLGFYF